AAGAREVAELAVDGTAAELLSDLLVAPVVPADAHPGESTGSPPPRPPPLGGRGRGPPGGRGAGGRGVGGGGRRLCRPGAAGGEQLLLGAVLGLGEVDRVEERVARALEDEVLLLLREGDRVQRRLEGAPDETLLRAEGVEVARAGEAVGLRAEPEHAAEAPGE